MTPVVGGIRTRLILDNLTYVLENGLASLGWLDPGRAHQPFQFLHGPHTWEVPVTFNAIVITNQSVGINDLELGSGLSMDSLTVTVDLYAESDSLGIHVSNDMRDVLRGRLGVGAVHGTFPILDFRLATPAPIGHAAVLKVDVQRSLVQMPEEWLRHVYTVATVIGDTYY